PYRSREEILGAVKATIQSSRSRSDRVRDVALIRVPRNNHLPPPADALPAGLVVSVPADGRFHDNARRWLQSSSLEIRWEISRTLSRLNTPPSIELLRGCLD